MAGIPEISIKLRELAKAKNHNASSDTVLLILKDTTPGIHNIRSISDIPSSLNTKNSGYIKDALKGGIQNKTVNGYVVPVALSPGKVIAKVVANETTIEAALEECKDIDFSVLAVPSAVQSDNTHIIAFIDYMYDNGLGCMAVIKDSTTSVKNRNIVRYTTEAEGYDAGESGTSELSARIAGVIAGVPLTQSVTYQILDDVKVTDNLKRNEIDTKIKAGELVIARMSGHTRIISGVTSFVPEEISEESPFSKIKLVQGYNFIQNAVKDILINNYLGKVQNSYDNKIMLCTTIKTDLLDNLKFVAPDSIVEIDTEAQKAYLKTQKVDVDSMIDEEIDHYRTNSKVFINMFYSVFDAMESFLINANIEA